jgi:hypothetical protein
MLVYLGIRLTHPDNVHDPAWDSEYIGKILEVLLPLGELKQMTYGHEVSVKSKRHHFHCHVSIDWDPQRKYIKGLATYIRRHLAEDHKVYLPEGHLSCIKQFTTFKKDTTPSRWFGYLFKDFEEQPTQHIHGFTPEEVRDMWIAAKRERELTIKTFDKHENKLNNDKQSRKLLWEYLDQWLPDLPIKPDKNLPSLLVPCPLRMVASRIVEYNITYNDYRIPMDLRRRAIQYLAYRGMPAWQITNLIL